MDEKTYEDKYTDRVALLKSEGMSDEEILGLMKLKAQHLPTQISRMSVKEKSIIQDELKIAEDYITLKEKK